MSYTLKCISEGEATQWIEWLTQAIYHNNQLLASGLQKWGWLEKKGQKRWFVLRQDKLMWFSQQQVKNNVAKL